MVGLTNLHGTGVGTATFGTPTQVSSGWTGFTIN